MKGGANSLFVEWIVMGGFVGRWGKGEQSCGGATVHPQPNNASGGQSENDSAWVALKVEIRLKLSIKRRIYGKYN